ncbi:MAG: C25 family peptidase propeptide domain-containing protein, partial [Ignavibacteria bacterium]
VPNVRLIDPRKKNFENYELTYDKDVNAYSQNKFMPGELLLLEGVGLVRELTMGNLIIYPYQYNPVTKVLKQYTRIRFRITFGDSPVSLNRKRSNAEEDLLKGIAVNSDIALNWMSPSLINYRTNPVIPSVLSIGDWHRIEIKDNGSGGSDGIYKLTKSFLESGGMNFANVDPRTIKIYGNGGYFVPESVNVQRPQDLVQIAIYFEGENDGVFDPQDYILFYGRGINNWKYDTTSRSFGHYLNYYSNSNYYWININTAGSGKRMMLVQSENVQNPIVPSSFTEKLFYEPEISNLIFEGNFWFSERKSIGQSFIWNITLTGLEANTDILYKIKPVARVICTPQIQYNIGYNIKEELSNVSEIYFPLGCVYGGFDNWISTGTTSFIINASQKSPPNSAPSTFRAAFITNSPEGDGYLDWMEIQYKRRFNSASNDFLRFTSPDTNGVVEYNV